MTLIKWIQTHYGANYSIFVYNKRCRSYVPYQNDIRLLYDREIKEVHQIKSHKLVWDKKLLMMVPDKPNNHIYIEEEK
ncbi:MAG: hypothetical protein IKF82_01050 [Bacilli bacterium]|nr:hypothetical protein [Bacilli bacterium]